MCDKYKCFAAGKRGLAALTCCYNKFAWHRHDKMPAANHLARFYKASLDNVVLYLATLAITLVHFCCSRNKNKCV